MSWVLFPPLVKKETDTRLQKSAIGPTVGKQRHHDFNSALSNSKAFLFHVPHWHYPILLWLGNPSKGKFLRWKVLFIPKSSHFMLQSVLFSGLFSTNNTMRFFFEFSEHSWERNQQKYLSHLPHQLILIADAIKIVWFHINLFDWTSASEMAETDHSGLKNWNVHNGFSFFLMWIFIWHVVYCLSLRFPASFLPRAPKVRIFVKVTNIEATIFTRRCSRRDHMIKYRFRP